MDFEICTDRLLATAILEFTTGLDHCRFAKVVQILAMTWN